MDIKERQVTLIKITDTELDPITVYIDEHKDEEYKGCCENDVRYKGRIVIVCYGVALNHYWGAMGSPMRKFFCQASTCYIVDKLLQNARETFKPCATYSFLDENDELREEEAQVNIETADHHRKYVGKIVEIIKTAFRKQLEEEDANR